MKTEKTFLVVSSSFLLSFFLSSPTCNKILVPRKYAHASNNILNHCLKSAVGRSCALGKSSKSESKQKNRKVN